MINSLINESLKIGIYLVLSMSPLVEGVIA